MTPIYVASKQAEHVFGTNEGLKHLVNNGQVLKSVGEGPVAIAGSSVPIICGAPTLSATAYDTGETITATAACVKGSTTVRTWQWYRDGSAITGETSETHVISQADSGAVLTVRQTETIGAESDYAETSVTLSSALKFIIKCAAGRVNFSWNNPTGRLWTFPAGTVVYGTSTPISTSTAEKPDVTIPVGGGNVILESADWSGNYSLNDNDTNAGYIGKFSDLPPLTYLLDLTSCSLITGSLSDLPALTYFLNLGNCTLITGSLSDLPPLTYFLNLFGCSLVTGSLADLPALTYFLSLNGCSLVTGSLADLPALTYQLTLNNCSLVTGSLADLPALTNTLNLVNCTLITGSLSDLPSLTSTLNLQNCSLITGAYTNVSGTNVPTTTTLSSTGMSATDMDNTLIAYAATTKNSGTFTATGKTRTAASDAAVATLTGAPRSWTITGITKV